jgi:hypothetical protein
MTRELVPASISELIASFNEKEREVYERLANLVKEVAFSELKGRFTIAMEIKKVYDEAKINKEIYGKDFFKKLAICLGFKSQTALREMYQVASRFTMNDINRIIDSVETLRWKDIVLLSKAESAEEEAKMLEDIKQKIATDTLLQKYKKGEKKSGRPVKVPNTAEEFIAVANRVVTGFMKKIIAFNEFAGDYLDDPSKINDLEGLANLVANLSTISSEVEYLRKLGAEALRKYEEMEEEELDEDLDFEYEESLSDAQLHTQVLEEEEVDEEDELFDEEEVDDFDEEIDDVDEQLDEAEDAEFDEIFSDEQEKLEK